MIPAMIITGIMTDIQTKRARTRELKRFYLTQLHLPIHAQQIESAPDIKTGSLLLPVGTANRCAA